MNVRIPAALRSNMIGSRLSLDAGGYGFNLSGSEFSEGEKLLQIPSSAIAWENMPPYMSLVCSLQVT